MTSLVLNVSLCVCVAAVRKYDTSKERRININTQRHIKAQGSVSVLVKVD